MMNYDDCQYLHPCKELDCIAPSDWTIASKSYSDAASLSCEVKGLCKPLTTEQLPLEWIYAIDSCALPKGTSGLSRITILLRGPEDSGMLKYTHSVLLCFNSRIIDYASFYDENEDKRVLEFFNFTKEKPLFFGNDLDKISIHVHLHEVPQSDIDYQSTIKIVADAVYSPIANVITTRCGLVQRLMKDQYGTLSITPETPVLPFSQKLDQFQLKSYDQSSDSADNKTDNSDNNADNNDDDAPLQRRPLWIREIEKNIESLIQ